MQLCGSESDERMPKKGNKHDKSERNTIETSICTIRRVGEDYETLYFHPRPTPLE